MILGESPVEIHDSIFIFKYARIFFEVKYNHFIKKHCIREHYTSSERTRNSENHPTQNYQNIL